MDRKIQRLRPDYRRIYTDIIDRKNPGKKKECKNLLSKDELSVLDILELNRRIFGNLVQDTEIANQKFRSYQESDILEILDFQKKNKLNNSQLAQHFKTSRNTIAKWKKLFSNNKTEQEI